MRRSDALRVLAVLSLGGAAWACTCSSPPDDAGVDARTEVTDATDASSDVPEVPSDTPLDAPHTEIPGFVRVGTDVLPADCDLRMAVDPMATHGGPLTFVPCPGRDGCRQIDVSWTTPQYPTFEVGMYESEHDGTLGHFAYARWAPDSSDEEFIDWQVIANDAGEIELILRSPRLRCNAAWFTLGEGRYATFVQYRDPDANRLGEYIVGGELSDPVGTFTVLGFLDPSVERQPLQDVSVSASAVAVEPAYADTVWRFDWDGTARRVASPLTDDGVESQLAFIRGDTVVVSATGASVGRELRGITGAGPAVQLVADTVMGTPALPSTDGVDLVWMNGVEPTGGPYFGRMELWTSPHCGVPACLAPRMVAVANARAHQSLRVGYGWVSYGVAANRIDFVSLADGSSRSVELPAGERWLRIPLFHGPDEVAVAPSISRHPGPPEAETVMFIRRDAL